MQSEITSSFAFIQYLKQFILRQGILKYCKNLLLENDRCVNFELYNWDEEKEKTSLFLREKRSMSVFSITSTLLILLLILYILSFIISSLSYWSIVIFDKIY